MKSDCRVAVIVSRFNRSITDNLLAGARQAAADNSLILEDGDVYTVPGAFELPVMAQKLARSGRYQAIVCLGAVIQGETPHFDYVCQGAAAGIQRVALESGLPIAFGVLTTDTVEQALARAGGDHGNKGYESLVSVVEMLEQLSRV